MGEERGVRSDIRFVDGEQGSRDGGVGSAPAIQKLCAVGDLLGERGAEGVGTPRRGVAGWVPRRKSRSGGGEAPSWGRGCRKAWSPGDGADPRSRAEERRASAAA